MNTIIRIALAAAFVSACSDPGNGVRDATGGDGSTLDARRDGSDDARFDAAMPVDANTEAGVMCGARTCASGESCADGGCACPSAVRCGSACCATGQVCYLAACTTPGATCMRRDECGTGSYCERSIGRCLPSAGPSMCEYRPTGTFHPEASVRWPRADTLMPEWSQILSTPLATPLAAPDPDGNASPIALVFLAGRDITTAHLRAIDGRDGHDLFHNTTLEFPGQSQIAAGDLDGDGTIEIVGIEAGVASACGYVGLLNGGHLVILDAMGRMRARSTEALTHVTGAPAIADLDGDGHAEIVVGATVFDSTAARRWVGTAGIGADACAQVVTMSIVADVTGDGHPEVIAGNTAYSASGAIVWQARATDGSLIPDGFAATADFERDGQVEIVVVHGASRGVSILEGRTGVERCRAPGDTSGRGIGGGPPVVADFDGDGRPEIGVVFHNRYTVFTRTCAVLWSIAVTDDSGQTGSSVFDFEGDGRAEVVYTDETQVRVMDGRDGSTRFTLPHSSATGTENPIVADLDADGHAEIVAVGQGLPALQVFRDADRNWVASRGIWNQHSYHVTNVLPSGAIPRTEINNWTVPYLNNYRANVQGEGAFDVPNLALIDLAVDPSSCPSSVLVRARVLNRGARGVAAGVRVRFDLSGDGFPMPVSVEARTTQSLLPGDSEVVSARAMLMTGSPAARFEVRAIVDPAGAMGFGDVRECIEDDNAAGPVAGSCTAPM